VSDNHCNEDDEKLSSTVDDEIFTHQASKTRILQQQNASPSENAAEDCTSAKRRQNRRLLKTAVTDDHCTEDDKLLLINSSSSSCIRLVESHSSFKSDDYTRYDSKSPALENHDAGKQPCSELCPPSLVSHDPSKQQKCLFKTTRCGICVFVYTGDLVQEKVDAVVNPSNDYLLHSGGAAEAIATAAGQQLQDECEQYITQKGPLNVTEVMHTSAGNMHPNVCYVIHAAGLSAREYPDQRKLQIDLRATFYNCLRYANDILKVKSMAIPAIGAGWCNP